jgi:hypothetical protein
MHRLKEKRVPERPERERERDVKINIRERWG